MRAVALLLVAEAVLLRSNSQVRAGKSIDAVIDVLGKMLKDFNDMAAEDKDNWEKYSKWSADEETDRRSFIQNQEGVIMSATAMLNANKQQVQTLTGQIADLTSEIAETQSSINELVKLRQEEHKTHEEEVTDLSKTIEAVNKATEVLEGHYAAGASMAEIKQEVTQALSTLALSRATDPKMKPVMNLLQDPNWLNVDGGAAYGSYTGVAAESGGVIGTLKSIRSTLMDQKQASIEKENDSQRQYEIAKESKEADLKRSKEEKASKEGTMEECNAKIEQCNAKITQATQDIADANKYIDKLLKDRDAFSKQFDERSAMRSQEMAATQAALDALQEVTAGSKSAVEGVLLQKFASLGVKCKRCGAAAKRLRAVGRKYHEGTLVQLAASLENRLHSRAKDPAGYFDAKAMDPVKNLLHQLITRLEDELAAETSHHDWCETEKATSAAAKAEREQNIDSLSAEIESLTTAIQQLTSDITFLNGELIRIQTETDTAIRLRKDEKETFLKAKGDHEEVIAALNKAMSALSAQYGFLQIKDRTSLKHKQSPFSEYSSGGESGASAMQMLQDLNNKYSTTLTELIADENSAVKAHEELLRTNEQFRKDTTQTKQAKETEKRQKTERLGNARVELAANRQELAEVVQYIADLRPSCDDIRVTFEERKKRREAEIAALKETLSVLEDPSMMR
jgi:chromosome segregation ATPase